MRKNIVLPFRFIRESSNAVATADWYHAGQTGTEVSWLKHGAGLDDWSYDTPMNIGRDVTFHSDLLLEELELNNSDVEFELIHYVRIGSLGIREVLHRETFRPGGTIKTSFFKKIESSSLCEEITLTSALVLKNNVKNVPEWAPSKKGAKCWSDETRIILEGYGSRFPMQDLPFSNHPRLPNQASWHLDWRPGLLHYSFNSAVTLYLNSEKTDFFERIQAGDEVVIEQVMSAITGEICGYLLEQDDFVSEDLDYPDGSLGSVARTWLQQALAGMTLSDIQSAFMRSPNTIHTALRGLAANI